MHRWWEWCGGGSGGVANIEQGSGHVYVDFVLDFVVIATVNVFVC